jgi:DNA-binding IclR family transcriptional regulator
LRNLVRRRYVSLDARTGRYILGEALGELARSASLEGTLSALAQPVLEEIAGRTGETVGLSLLREEAAEVVSRVNSTEPLRYAMAIGERMPLHATSTGKVLLAHLPSAEVKERLGGDRLRRVTQYSPTSLAVLRRQLAQVLQDGYAYSSEEYILGAAGLAVPLLSPDNVPIAALTVAYPKARDSDSLKGTALAALRDGVSRLSAALGSASSHPPDF